MAVTNKTYADAVERLTDLHHALILLKDIYEHLEGGAPLYPGSLIFEEDSTALAVIGTFLRKTRTINARP